MHAERAREEFYFLTERPLHSTIKDNEIRTKFQEQKKKKEITSQVMPYYLSNRLEEVTQKQENTEHYYCLASQKLTSTRAVEYVGLTMAF